MKKFMMVVIAAMMTMGAVAQDKIYIWKNGIVLSEFFASEVDSIGFHKPATSNANFYFGFINKYSHKVYDLGNGETYDCSATEFGDNPEDAVEISMSPQMDDYGVPFLHNLIIDIAEVLVPITELPSTIYNAQKYYQYRAPREYHKAFLFCLLPAGYSAEFYTSGLGDQPYSLIPSNVSTRSTTYNGTEVKIYYTTAWSSYSPLLTTHIKITTNQ